MRYGKAIIVFFSIAFLGIAVYFGLQDSVPEKKPDTEISLSVIVQSNGKTEEIDCWEDEAGEYYIFLPSYADLTHTTISFDRNAIVSIDNQQIENGATCESLQLDTPYALKYVNKSRNLDTTLTFLQSGNVPTIYIDVQSGNMDYIHAVKGNEESGKMRLYSADGGLEYAGSIKSINGRGNSTWECSKKPYSLSLTYEADLLGMGAAEKWILLANAYDASNLRNKIVYDFAQAVGLDYSPQCQWVDLYLNGDYAGLYLLSTRNEIHEQRVAISQKNRFLVSMESKWRMEVQGIPYVKTDSSSFIAFRIHDSTIKRNKLQEILQSVENAILAEDGIDSVTGKSYLDFIDLDSWAKKYLIEEIFGNLDATGISQFFYWDGNDETGKMYAGPVWDYDYSMGYRLWPQTSVPTAFLVSKPHAYSADDSPWFYALYQRDAFYNCMLSLYQTIYTPLLENLLETGIDQYLTYISQAAAMNQIRHGIENAAVEAEYMQSFLTERIEFLNSVWLDNEEYCIVQVAFEESFTFACYAVRPGECIPDLSWYFSEPVNWYIVGTGELFDISQPIYQDVAICLEAEQNGEEQISSFQYIPGLVILIMLFVLFRIDKFRIKRKG